MAHANLLAVCGHKGCARFSTYSPCGRCRFHAERDQMSLAAKGIAPEPRQVLHAFPADFIPAAAEVITPQPQPFADLHLPPVTLHQVRLPLVKPQPLLGAFRWVFGHRGAKGVRYVR